MSTITTRDNTEIYDGKTGPVATPAHPWPVNTETRNPKPLSPAQHGHLIRTGTKLPRYAHDTVR